MKKGLTYIDWSISIGLFIIYLLILFITFRPGAVDDYSSDHLTSMVEKNLREDTYQTMVRVPIYVDVGAVGAGSNKVDIVDFSTTWDKYKTFMLDEYGKEVVYDLDGSLKIEYVFSSGVNTFWFYYFDNDFLKESEVVCPCKTKSDGISYAFGVQEEIKGFYEKNLTDIGVDDLDLKDVWSYPDSRDFNITFFEGLDFNKKIWGYSTALDPSTEEATNVYALQWSDWFLDVDPSDGISRNSTTVVVKVW